MFLETHLGEAVKEVPGISLFKEQEAEKDHIRRK